MLNNNLRLESESSFWSILIIAHRVLWRLMAYLFILEFILPLRVCKWIEITALFWIKSLISLFKDRNAKIIVVESVESIVFVWNDFIHWWFLALSRLYLIQLENIFTLNILNRWWSNRQIHWCLIIWTRNRNRNLDSFLFLSSKSIWLRRSLNRNIVIRFDVSRWGIINVVIDVLVVVSVLECTWASFGNCIDGLEL